jgi:hypothetical protein
MAFPEHGNGECSGEPCNRTWIFELLFGGLNHTSLTGRLLAASRWYISDHAFSDTGSLCPFISTLLTSRVISYLPENWNYSRLQTLTDTSRNQIVLDMDGRGLSGRFYLLLESESAVMKQGTVRKWHDSRLLPSLHYVPLSMGMQKLEAMLEDFFGVLERAIIS